MSVAGVNAYQTEPLFAQSIGSSGAAVAPRVSRLLVNGRLPMTTAFEKSSLAGWARAAETKTRLATSKSSTAPIGFIASSFTPGSCSPEAVRDACPSSVDVSVPPEAAESQAALSSARVEVRKGLVGRREPEEGAEPLPPFAADDVEDEEVVGPAGEVSNHFLVPSVVVAQDLVPPRGVVVNPVAVRDRPGALG